jgi:hypothetical protein
MGQMVIDRGKDGWCNPHITEKDAGLEKYMADPD